MLPFFIFNIGQQHHGFWVELWYAFVLESISLSLVYVCFFLQKKKKNINQ